MYKKVALAVLLLQGTTNAINIRESSVAKHAFIKRMRDANKAKGTSRRMNWNKLTEKSVHKPGLRSTTTARTSDSSISSKHSSSYSEKEEDLDRDLSWWNWNSNNNATAEGDVNATEQNNDGSWFSWNWNNTQDDDDMWVRQGQNVSYVMNGLKDFSIKYAGCSSLTSYSTPDDNEEDASYPFVNNNYVSYRLCPTESCKDDSWRGCKQVYGEYMMDLEEFLAAQQSYVEEEFEAYCTYCENCMYFDKWYSGWNRTTYDENVHGCDLYEECMDYEQNCDQQYHEEQEKELGYNYEDFLECTEVDVDLSYYGVDTDMSSQVQENMGGNYGYDQDGEYNMQKAYIGPHCDEGVIGIGLFMDDACTQFVGNKFDLFNATGYEAEADVIDDVYVPQGCHSCAGENIRNSKWYIPEDERQGEEYEQYVEQVQNGDDEENFSEVCYYMYTASAKCHNHFTEDDFSLELTDSELVSEQATCDFIDDVIKGHIDEEGFVWSHQQRVNPISNLFGLWADDSGLETRVTAAQVAGLMIGAIACAGMGFVAYQLKMQVDAQNPMKEGLVATTDNQID